MLSLEKMLLWAVNLMTKIVLSSKIVKLKKSCTRNLPLGLDTEWYQGIWRKRKIFTCCRVLCPFLVIFNFRWLIFNLLLLLIFCRLYVCHSRSIFNTFLPTIFAYSDDVSSWISPSQIGDSLYKTVSINCFLEERTALASDNSRLVVVLVNQKMVGSASSLRIFRVFTPMSSACSERDINFFLN